MKPSAANPAAPRPAMTTGALPPAGRRSIALAAERAVEVEDLLAAAIAVLGAGGEGDDGGAGELDPGAANWRGRLECVRADLAAPLRRALAELRRELFDGDRVRAGRRPGRSLPRPATAAAAAGRVGE
jgi:hypothetical protein